MACEPEEREWSPNMSLSRSWFLFLPHFSLTQSCEATVSNVLLTWNKKDKTNVSEDDTQLQQTALSKLALSNSRQQAHCIDSDTNMNRI